MPEVDSVALLLLLLAGFSAGWVDAVVGGGGLIQLPALLLVPGLTPLNVLATNKVGSIMGTTTSAITYYRRVHPDMRTAAPMAVAALLGAIGGAALAAQIPAELFRPIIVVACMVVLAWTVARPAAGLETVHRLGRGRHHAVAALLGAIIGTYDGLLGPGTGSFLVISLVGVLGYGFVPASAIAKIVNMATNAGALLFFIPGGHVVWGLGLAVGAANMLGGYVGARTAVARGSRFVRVVFLVVVTALLARLVRDIVAA
ncbi:MAG: TSUP family transporter [Actinomycetota bacterium]